MRTDDIANAFKAIVEEVERIQDGELTEEARTGLAKIVSIAKHQKDIRQSAGGSCKAKT